MPDAPSQVIGTRNHGQLARQCAITACAIALVATGAMYLPLPGLDARSTFAMPASSWSWATGSVFALGTTSFFVAALIVDLQRRIRRTRSPALPDTTSVILVGFLLAAVFAYHLIRSVHNAVGLSSSTKITWLVALLAGQGALAVLARLISRQGIGQGFAIFSAFGIAGELFDLASFLHAENAPAPSSSDLGQWIGVPMGIALLTALTVRRRPTNDWFARTPVSGIGSVVLAYTLPSIVTGFALFGVVDASLAVAMTPGKWTFSLATTVVAALLTIALGLASHPGLWSSTEQPFRSALWRSMPVSILFVLVFVWRPAFVDRNIVDPLSVVVTTVVVMDIATELSARAKLGQLVVIARMVDVAHADIEALKLQHAKIAVLRRGEFFSTMTRFFGVLVPVEIMVPRGNVEQALDIIHESKAIESG